MTVSTHHTTGVNHVARYFREDCHCNPVLTEVVASADERVDALGFGPNFSTYAGDWKNSTEDAIAHMRKPHVQSPFVGVGMLRVIVCHRGVVEWTDPRIAKAAGCWPEWLGLVWMDDDGQFTVNREPDVFTLDRRQSKAEWELLRRAAGKGEQSNSVTKRGTVDQALALIQQDGPQTAAQLRRSLGLDMPAAKLARLLDRDGRLRQDHAGGEWRMAG